MAIRICIHLYILQFFLWGYRHRTHNEVSEPGLCPSSTAGYPAAGQPQPEVGLTTRPSLPELYIKTTKNSPKYAGPARRPARPAKRPEEQSVRRVVRDGTSGGALWHLGGAFWRPRRVVLAPLGSILAALGTICPTLSTPECPIREKSEKNLEQLVRGSCPGPPRGTNFETFSRKSRKMQRRGRFFLRFGPISFFASVWTGL